VSFGSPSPPRGSELVAAARRVIAAARGALRAPAPEAVSTLVDALGWLARWRIHVASGPVSARGCGFLATCLVRLATHDASAGRHEEVCDACQLRAAGPPDVVAVHRAEALAFTPFTPCPDVEAALLAAGHAWNEKLFDGWAAVAYALCVRVNGEGATAAPPELLLKCAEFDAACVTRLQLRSRLSSANAQPVDARRALVDAWALRVTHAANDEVFELGREAGQWTYLTPAGARLEGTPSVQLSRSFDPERVAVASAASCDGFKLLGTPVTPLHLSALHLFLFDYRARQLASLDFMHLFFLSDLRADAALETLDREEDFVQVPPYLVHSLGTWYLYLKQEPLDVSASYDCAADALLAWLDCVVTHQGGFVCARKSVVALAADVTTPIASSDPRAHAAYVEPL
jgi:hypothetical protein